MTAEAPRRHRVLRHVVSGGVAVTLGMSASVLATPATHADQTYYVPVSKSWVVTGRGYGHGHGMSQYGAQGAAIKGRGYRQIIRFYYPGTAWGHARGRVRVLVGADKTSDLQVRPAKRLTVRDLRDGARWRLPSGNGVHRWRLTPIDNGSTAVQFHNSTGWHRWRIPGKRKTLKSDGQFSAAGPLRLLVPGSNGVSGVAYRGILRLVRPSRGAPAADTVNVLSMDSYVRGVVPYEMPASWRPQALRAQAVAARTYAAWQRSQAPDRYFQICDTTACQVYGGVAAEQASSNAAVRATAREILTYHGKAAFTQFSSSSGGWTSSGGVAYLPAKRDPYDDFDANPMHRWSVRV
nr:SpoIID/LytB domain-containing protein [Propionibacteriales bacterium]